MGGAEGGTVILQDVSGESTKLGGQHRLELTRFTEKQYWIDEKIALLVSLPSVDALSPLPPDSSPVDRAQLSNWYDEFAIIEQQVEDYDMGDLASLRKFAAGSSKRDLSNEDTDLLEVTLTTLLSLDRLLSLLRHRHQQLDLLTYRIRWEEQLALAWTEYRRILDDLPPLIQRSRWTRPAPNSDSSSSFDETLSPDLVAYFSLIDGLLKSTIPAAAHHLDKIIDTSPTALPDSFLESQESLEDTASELTTGLGAFIGKLRRQTERFHGHWRTLEGIASSLNGVVRGLDAIRETGMRSEDYDVYGIPLVVAMTDLIRIKGDTKEFDSPLFHSAVPEQATNAVDVLSIFSARHEELVEISDAVAQRLGQFHHAALLSDEVEEEERVRAAAEEERERSTARRVKAEDDQSREQGERRIKSFRYAVKQIDVDEWSDVPPSSTQLNNLFHQLSLARSHFGSLLATERLQVADDSLELDRKESILATLRALVELGEAVVVADHAISDLLESIDVANGLDPFLLPPDDSATATPARPLLPLDSARMNAIDSVNAVRKVSATIEDPRRATQLTRLEGILAEMLELADEAAQPRTPIIFEHTVASPRPVRARSTSASSSRPPSSSRASSRLSSLSTTEEGQVEKSITSIGGPNPQSHLPHVPSHSPTTPPPARSLIPRQSVGKSNGTPHGKTIGIGRPVALFRSTSSASASTSALAIPRSSRAVSSPSPKLSGSIGSIGSMGRPRVSSNESIQSGRSRVSSNGSNGRARASLSSKVSRKEEEAVRFVPRRKDRVVDIEVARILSENSWGVTIKAADDADDISGKYWIGDDEPRLYFIRILRSSTAMVRVGGGWMELSIFLSKHYSSAVQISPSTIHAAFPVSISLTSLSLEPNSLSASYSSNSLASSTRSIASSTHSLAGSTRSAGSMVSGGTASPARSRKSVGGSGTPRWRM